MTAPTFVAASGAVSAGGTASVPQPAGVIEDDILLAVIISNATALTARPDDFDIQYQNTITGNHRVEFATHIVGAADPGPYDWTAGAAAVSVSMCAYRGVDSVTPILDVDASFINVAGTSLPSPAHLDSDRPDTRVVWWAAAAAVAASVNEPWMFDPVETTQRREETLGKIGTVMADRVQASPANIPTMYGSTVSNYVGMIGGIALVQAPWPTLTVVPGRRHVLYGVSILDPDLGAKVMVAGATVSVISIATGSVIDAYADADDVAPVAQPIAVDANGMLSVWVDDETVRLHVKDTDNAVRAGTDVPISFDSFSAIVAAVPGT